MNQYLIKVVLIATVFNFARTCPEGQYYSKFLDSCSSCSGSNCKGEEDEEACKNACIKGPNVTESTPRDPGTTEGETSISTKKIAVTRNQPNDVKGGTNPTMLAGILSAAIALVLVPVVGLALHFHRKNRIRNNQSHPIARENEHMEMEDMQGRHEDNQQVPPPSPTETDDDRQYNGPETLFDLNKDERGSVLNLGETTL